jgi:hypothetical protein
MGEILLTLVGILVGLLLVLLICPKLAGYLGFAGAAVAALLRGGGGVAGRVPAGWLVLAGLALLAGALILCTWLIVRAFAPPAPVLGF